MGKDGRGSPEMGIGSNGRGSGEGGTGRDGEGSWEGERGSGVVIRPRIIRLRLLIPRYSLR